MIPSSTAATPPRCADFAVILLEDDEVFRTGLTELLRDDGHRVEAYGSIAEMPQTSELPPASVLIADYQLGQSDGLSFAERFHSVHPHVPIILLTAYASAHLIEAAAALPYLSLLRKPLLYDQLHELLHKLMRARS